MSHHLILRVVAKFLIPLILLFALYVHFHGELGPGGAFQAGAIIAAAFILHCLIFGLNKTRPIAPPGVLRVLAGLGVLVYGGTGLVSLLFGANFLDYNVLGSSPTAGQHVGIILIEVGVLLTVASVLTLIFFTFAGRQREDAQ